MDAYYYRVPTAEELQGTGFKPHHYKAPEVELWPENYQVWAAFTLLQGQWRCGPSGPIGLDYNVVYREFERMGLAGDDFDDALDAMRVLEIAAMKELMKEG